MTDERKPTPEERGKALQELRIKMLDYEGNAAYQQWKAERVLPMLSQRSFDDVIVKFKEFNLSPTVQEVSKLFMPQRALAGDLGHYLRKWRNENRPIPPFQKIAQLEEENQALRAQIQALQFTLGREPV
jgi:hypothetical protein